MRFITVIFPLLFTGAMAVPGRDKKKSNEKPQYDPTEGGKYRVFGEGVQQASAPVNVPYHLSAGAAERPYPGYVPAGEKVGQYDSLTSLEEGIKRAGDYMWGDLPNTRYGQ